MDGVSERDIYALSAEMGTERRDRMNKKKLQPGKKYLHRRQTMIDDVLREAERWIKCERITPTGAIFSRDFEPRIRMTDAQIEREVHER